MTVSRRTFCGTAACAGVVAGVLTACGSGAPEPAAPPEGGGTGGTGEGEVLVALADVPVGGAVVVTTGAGERIVVAQPEEGDVVGLSAVCTHQGCVVEADGAELVCPCHLSRFTTASGEVLEGPASRPLPAVPVRVEGADVVLG